MEKMKAPIQVLLVSHDQNENLSIEKDETEAILDSIDQKSLVGKAQVGPIPTPVYTPL